MVTRPTAATCSSTHRLLRLICAAALSLAVAASGLPAREGPKRFTVAVVPQFTPAAIKKDWTPLLARLSRETGFQLELKLYKSIPAFERDLLNGAPDFAYMSPYHAVLARRTRGYVPLLRDGAHNLTGIVVVPKEGLVSTIGDLNGKIVAFPSPNAFAASLYIRTLLARKEGVFVKPKYVKTHSNVYRHVALGTAAAGGGANRTLNREPAELRDRLKIIYETPSAAPHPLCAHPRIAPADRQSLVEAFFRIAKDPEAQSVLNAVELASPVRADFDRDYAPIADLGLEAFAVKGRD